MSPGPHIYAVWTLLWKFLTWCTEGNLSHIRCSSHGKTLKSRTNQRAPPPYWPLYRPHIVPPERGPRPRDQKNITGYNLAVLLQTFVVVADLWQFGAIFGALRNQLCICKRNFVFMNPSWSIISFSSYRVIFRVYSAGNG